MEIQENFIQAHAVLERTCPGSKNIYSVSKTLIGLARNETNDELLFPRLDFFSRDQREVSCIAKAVGQGQTGRPVVKGKKKVQPRKKKFIKGFSFLYSSQLSCLRRQIHFLSQFLCVQPSVLEWLTYFNIPLIDAIQDCF